MSFAPKHDYQEFDAASASSRIEAIRQATPTEKAERYGELLATCIDARGFGDSSNDIYEHRLREKIARRLRQLEVFKNSDMNC